MSIWNIAHAGETHEGAIESSQHYLEVDPMVSVPLALAIMIGVPFILKLVLPKSDIPVMVLLTELLLVGLLTFKVLPALSVISIIFGFLLALLFSFGALSVKK